MCTDEVLNFDDIIVQLFVMVLYFSLNVVDWTLIRFGYNFDLELMN